MNLKNKVVLVTGGAIGIGEAVSRMAAEKGAKVIVNYNRSKEEGEKLVKEIIENGGEAIAVKADVSKEDEVKNLFKSAVEEFGTVDVLVNNASYSVGEDFLKSTKKFWMGQMENNFSSAVMCSQEFVRLNQGKNEKKIINISSLYGQGGEAGSDFMAYAATKGALNNFTQNLAKASAPILVNAIAPGYVYTPQWFKNSEEAKKSFEEQTLIGRFIKPEEIADAVIFMAQNDALTGSILTIDGGLSLKG